MDRGKSVEEKELILNVHQSFAWEGKILEDLMMDTDRIAEDLLDTVREIIIIPIGQDSHSDD